MERVISKNDATPPKLVLRRNETNVKNIRSPNKKAAMILPVFNSIPFRGNFRFCISDNKGIRIQPSRSAVQLKKSKSLPFDTLSGVNLQMQVNLADSFKN